MYTITLHDGTQITDCDQNGTNYVAPGIVDDAIFENNLQTVTIEGEGETLTLTNQRLLCNTVRDGQSWIAFGGVSPLQDVLEKLTIALLEG